MTLVEALGVVVSTATFRRGVRACVGTVARVGPLGGASLSLALAADLTTFLTTHVAALHVYSSLLVTGQWHVGAARFGGRAQRERRVGDVRRLGADAARAALPDHARVLPLLPRRTRVHGRRARLAGVRGGGRAARAAGGALSRVFSQKGVPGDDERRRDTYRRLFLRVDPAGAFETATLRRRFLGGGAMAFATKRRAPWRGRAGSLPGACPWRSCRSSRTRRICFRGGAR